MQRFFVAALILVIVLGSFAQDVDESSKPDGTEDLLPEAVRQRLVPIFPAESSALISIEAEDAVSTNFAKEPTLDYSASGFRTLQLNRYTALSGGDPFLAEFAFFVEEAGTYELWYGGTPPGPREDVFPSYASPFRYHLDGGAAVAVYREDVHVTAGYSPSYYWVRVGNLELTPGIHTLRFTIAEKRRFDGKFIFFLDAIHLVDRPRFDTDNVPVPDIFPDDLSSTILDAPFRSINDYEYLIGQDPDNATVYIELSLIYSLIGDYNNALKNLSRAALIDPLNPEVQLLSAKNRIWKGDAVEGLRAYERLLQIDPSQVNVWAEAGKVAAWIGKYRDSIQFYRAGSREFPDELNLIVNLGITYLWDNQADQAEVMFDTAARIAFEEISKIPQLGKIYMVNGYPDRSISTYREAIRVYPEHLEFYLKLEEAYTEIGRVEDAEIIHAQIAERFVVSDRLSAYLDTTRIKQSMKNEVIAGYQAQLERDPDNLDLRELLVQTYFWNGLRQRAIDEYLNILTNYAYLAFIEFDSRNADLLSVIDSLYLYRQFYDDLSTTATEMKRVISTAEAEYRLAVRGHDRYQNRIAKAKEKGEAPPEIDGEHPAETLAHAENTLANAVREAEGFLTWRDATVGAFTDVDATADPFLIEEQEDREAFTQVVSSKGWSWDRRSTLSELESVSAAGVVLGDHVLSRLRLIEGDSAAALASAERVLSPKFLPVETIYSLSQARHWQDVSQSRIPYTPEAALTEHLEYVSGINDLARELTVPSGSVTGFFAETTPDKANALLADLEVIPKSIAIPQRRIDDSLASLHGVLENRMVRLFYQIDQDTYLLRFELGDYYLLEKRYRLAINEFQKVLTIDPWNTSATFKLGTLHQLAGDWRQAMAKYRQVYFADPRFESVAGNYNYLARLYADTLLFENYLMADSSLITYHAHASLTNNLSGVFGLDIAMSSDTLRRYQAFGGVLPGTYQRVSVTASLPITIAAIQTKIAPLAGVILSPSLMTDRLSFASDAANPFTVLGTYEIEPELGADIGINIGPVFVGGVYRYARVAETLFPERPRVLAHSGELNAVLALGFLDIPLLQYSSARTYGKYDYRLHEDGASNSIFAVAQDLTQVFHLADAPWTNLTVAVSVVYETATDATVDFYYAPKDVLSMKGSASIASWLGVADGNVLGLSFRADAGLYAADSFNPGASGDMLFEAEARAELTKGDSTYYLSLLGSATFDEYAALPKYWAAFLRMGYTAKLPRLLAD